jgi:hypothetical protein
MGAMSGDSAADTIGWPLHLGMLLLPTLQGFYGRHRFFVSFLS